MITIKNLTVSYKSNKRVIDNLELLLHENHIHGIVGLNGAGKTTLLNTIYGLKKKDWGTITWNGQKYSKQVISFLPTENYFYSGITGREYLNLFKNPFFREDSWNDLFLLPLDKIIDEYSTGMKKKLALIGVLKQDKPLMILDEPFDRLDIETGK
ncbi:MAG: ATP-binding cassette domain-containing protein [Bacteroidales bacterium]|nr:ATP-binding cassette domain-containing protein [Bacteroidales bacterium]